MVKRKQEIPVEEKYLRVTEVLYPFSGLSNIDEFVLARAARRGTRVHKACESLIEDGKMPPLDDEIAGYVYSFEKWWRHGHEILSTEERFYCSELMITGQCDLIIKKPHGAVILDIKTPAAPSKTWPLQGSAYAYLAKKAGYDIQSIQFLQLNKHGMEPQLYDYEYDFEFFKKCLDVYNHFFRKRDDGEKKVEA